MPWTPLHHKPISYGGPLFDYLFLALVVVHFIPAAIAPVASIVAFATRKGGGLHVRSGRWFVRSMWTVATTGIVIDAIRLTLHVQENHTKYAGYSMPSTYPARLGFLYAGFCVLYLLRETAPPNVFRTPPPVGLRALWVPALLVTLGVALTALIVLKFNPWTGALWMIVTFAPVIVFAARGRARLVNRAAGVAHHRFGMGVLAAFSWWGALQGFGPWIGILINGVDLSTKPYVGDRPGPFTPIGLFFVIPWAACFVIAAIVVRRIKKRAAVVPLRSAALQDGSS
jgi:hypothetical protein